jgi:hypothetical protein
MSDLSGQRIKRRRCSEDCSGRIFTSASRSLLQNLQVRLGGCLHRSKVGQGPETSHDPHPAQKWLELTRWGCHYRSQSCSLQAFRTNCLVSINVVDQKLKFIQILNHLLFYSIHTELNNFHQIFTICTCLPIQSFS